jgi:hypothetical protein
MRKRGTFRSWLKNFVLAGEDNDGWTAVPDGVTREAFPKGPHEVDMDGAVRFAIKRVENGRVLEVVFSPSNSYNKPSLTPTMKTYIIGPDDDILAAIAQGIAAFALGK